TFADGRAGRLFRADGLVRRQHPLQLSGLSSLGVVQARGRAPTAPWPGRGCARRAIGHAHRTRRSAHGRWPGARRAQCGEEQSALESSRARAVMVRYAVIREDVLMTLITMAIGCTSSDEPDRN